MKHKRVIAFAVLAGLMLAVGYWWGRSSGNGGNEPVAAIRTAGSTDAEAREAGAGPQRRILYYRNPMGHDDTSPVPKKDPMGMDYIPVYEDEPAEGSRLQISLDRLQTLGVRTEIAAGRTLSRTVRTVGTVEASEPGLYSISPRFEGWITQLLVNTTGAKVRRGQPLFAVYSPELVTTQEEYRIASEAMKAMGDASPEARASAQALVDGGLQRLRNWGIADEDLDDLRSGKGASQSLLLRSPTDGVVIGMTARAGMRFMPGETLFQIADLSQVWIVASVFEQDLGFVRPGQAAAVTLAAYPGRIFEGRVAFIHPTLDPATRTARVHIELPNEDGLLKPELSGSVVIAAGDAVAAVAIPESAVLDSGTRRVVLIELGGGAFEPREVELGARGDGYVEVISGLGAGEPVVVDGNFLIDAESNFKAALGALGGHAHGGMAPAADARKPGTAAKDAAARDARDPHAGH